MKTVAIIGAGPAGLSAAYTILTESNDFQVTIFEKDSQVGGLSKTFEYCGGRLDIGGHRFFSKNNEVLQLWESVLPYSPTGMLHRERKSHILWNGKLIEYPIQITSQTIKALGFSQGVKVVASYLAYANKHPEIKSLEDFYIHRFGRTLYKMFFEHYTYKLWGIPANQLSPDWGMQRVQKLSLYSFLHSTLSNKLGRKTKERSLIAEYSYPAYGSSQLWDSMRDKILEHGGIVKYNCKITRLLGTKHHITGIEYQDNHNNVIQNFDYVISSMPLKELIDSVDQVPDEIRQVANRLIYRDMMILGIEFSKEDMGAAYKTASKDSWLYIQDPKITFGRVQILNNWSPNAVSHHGNILLELEFFCNENDQLWAMDEKDLLNQSVSELVNCGLCGEQARARSYIIKHITKAYPVYNEGYYQLDTVKEWINRIDNLRCIGRNGQHRYNNMDHSVETGIEAAKSILTTEYDLRRLWSVNDKQEYLETK